MKEVRCAIYTRKSTEEGLDKEFNTLEAQREAGENYVLSQKHQGWKIIPEHYDDGGFSGGNMNRPALERLLEDINAGKVDMIVVYKIDRLTRSLTDFSKMIEILEKNNCSFVSVTQNFNTADSMGRLMLNILLSFAQFEREVSGERIRDKVAASKKKGMWMGGAVPTGYVAINKKLKIKPEEGEMIRFMFESYLKHKSITAVCKLVKDNYGIEYRREMIKRLLKNPVYLGKVKHKNELYDGQHPAIIDQETFDKVAEIRSSKDVAKRSCLYKKNEVGILRGILTCGCCHTRMTPTVSMGHGRRRYYYTSTKAKYYGYHTCHNGSVAVAILDEAIIQIITPMLKDAHILNGLIKQIAPDKTKELFKIMQHPEKVLAKMSELDKSLLVKELIENITVQCDNLEIKWTALALDILPDKYASQTKDGIMTIDVPLSRTHGVLQVTVPEALTQTSCPNKELIKALSKAFKYQKILTSGRMTIAELSLHEELDAGYLGRILRLTSLAPDIIKSVLAGTQPADFILKRLIREEIPPIWAEQRKKYNFPEI